MAMLRQSADVLSSLLCDYRVALRFAVDSDNRTRHLLLLYFGCPARCRSPAVTPRLSNCSASSVQVPRGRQMPCVRECALGRMEEPSPDCDVSRN